MQVLRLKVSFIVFYHVIDKLTSIEAAIFSFEILTLNGVTLIIFWYYSK